MKTGGNAAHRSAFPAQEPEIEVVRLEEPPFEVECRELRWQFIIPEVGESIRRADYDHPSGAITLIEEWAVTGQGQVYGKESREIRNRSYAPDGKLLREAYAYGTLDEGVTRWLGWWNLSDDEKFYTWKDEGFEADWGATPIRIADVGRYRWLDDRHIERQGGEENNPKLDGNGAGLCLLRIGEREHRCLRVIEAGDPSDPADSLLEAFVNAEGRTLLTRRYAAPQYPVHSQYNGIPLYDWEGTRQAQDLLKDSPALVLNGTTYFLWYDCLSERGL